jgi:hypothetical protein
MAERFRDPADVLERLRHASYLADESIASVVFLADRLEKPAVVPPRLLERSSRQAP